MLVLFAAGKLIYRLNLGPDPLALPLQALVTSAAMASIFLVLALLNAAVAVYIYTVIPDFVLRFVAWAVSHVMYRLRVDGDGNIPETGPAVLAAKSHRQ